MPFDWNKILGFGMRQDDENDPFRPTTEDRRQIMSAAMQGLGGAMMKSAMSPSWAEFGLNFSEGLGQFGDIQRQGYEAYAKKNRDRAKFDEDLEQERIATKQNKLNLSQDEESDQKRKDFEASIIPALDSQMDWAEETLKNAKIDPANEGARSKFMTDIPVLRSLLRSNPGMAIERAEALAESVAKLTGEEQGLARRREEAFAQSAMNAGWMIEGPDGGMVPDTDGYKNYLMQEVQDKAEDRALTRESIRFSMEDRRADNARLASGGTGGSGQSTAPTIEKVDKETKRIIDDSNTLRRKIADNGGYIDDTDRALAVSLGLTVSKDPRSGQMILSMDDMSRLEEMSDDADVAREIAFSNTINTANQLNKSRGKKPISGADTETLPDKTGEKPQPEPAPTAKKGEKPVADNLSEPPLQKSRMSTPDWKEEMGKKIPTQSEASAMVKELGAEKAVKLLESKGLLRSQIKELYGI